MENMKFSQEYFLGGTAKISLVYIKLSAVVDMATNSSFINSLWPVALYCSNKHTPRLLVYQFDISMLTSKLV